MSESTAAAAPEAATEYTERAGLKVHTSLAEFISREALPGTGIDEETFWEGFAGLVHTFAPRIREALRVRDEMQARIDRWYRERGEAALDPAEQERFLKEIGYIVPRGEPFTIGTENVDDEIARVAGPQLVVPVMNARYALNAANARWGSLYDALYGTDALGAPAPDVDYDPRHGRKVIDWTRAFLDDVLPLATGSWKDITGLSVRDGRLVLALPEGETALADETGFAGWRGESPERPSGVLLRHHDLHIEIVVDPDHPVGRQDAAGIADVILESALSTICDCEDSVAAVDAEDKVTVYANWLGLMKGDLESTFIKKGRKVTRRLAPDREWRAPDGTPFTLPGRALLLVRNVGLLMTTDMVLDEAGREIPETLCDAMVNLLSALHDVGPNGRLASSRRGSVYVVCPKLHGPEEVALMRDILAFVEQLYGLPENTVKMGIMDEERRTTLNLPECIRAARDRVFFINTGFLDRTGDEIHTAMEAGPVLRKNDMKSAPWLLAYEDWNVDWGLACGFPGRAQIGKGMWAMPNMMAAMLREKIAHPQAGANTAWVPSPTAATLHATHYHRVNVAEVQARLKAQGPRARLQDLLQVPVVRDPAWSPEEIDEELRNNAQGLLGYVVRWVEQGIGCSTVPDIRDIGLMEDRATLRISSQHMANWLYHGIVSGRQVMDTLREMAAVVDRQNARDPHYRPMSPDPDASEAFQAAVDLVFRGREQPNGYTEPILHARRRRFKARLRQGLN